MAEQHTAKNEPDRKSSVVEIARNIHTPEGDIYRATAPWVARKVAVARDYYTSAYRNRRKKSSR